MSATTTAAQHVIATIRAVPALVAALPGGVWEGTAPVGCGYPVCVVQPYGPGRDLTGSGGYRTGTHVDVLVRVAAVCDDQATVAAMVDAVDAHLHASGPATYGTAVVAGCLRTVEIADQPVDTGRGETRSHAAVYHLLITAP